MARTHPVRLLAEARASSTAVAAVNAVNLETAEAVVGAAEDEGMAVILQVSQNAARYAGLTRLAAIGRVLRDEARVAVVLHFDHAESVETALAAFDLGFDSVMLQGADMPPAERIAALRQLSQRAREIDGAVEAEGEVTPKGPRGRGPRSRPEDLRDFVEASGCTSLAVDVGSDHKQIERHTRLDHERLRAVADVVPVPLVLHGSSGVPDDELVRAVRGGISKVNLATVLMLAFTRGLRSELADDASVDPRRYLGAGRASMREAIRGYLRLLGGSSTRA